MGRIRGKWVKKMAATLIEIYPDKFNKDFENNKKLLVQLNLIDDKPVRNKVAGFIANVLEKRG